MAEPIRKRCNPQLTRKPGMPDGKVHEDGGDGAPLCGAAGPWHNGYDHYTEKPVNCRGCLDW